MQSKETYLYLALLMALLGLLARFVWITAPWEETAFAAANLSKERGESAPRNFPVLADRGGADEYSDLRVRFTSLRGALRFRWAPDPDDDVRLVIASTADGVGRLETRRPDFQSDRGIEFYGIEAGSHVGYLTTDVETTELLPLSVTAFGIREYDPGRWKKISQRRLIVQRGGKPLLGTATLTAQFESLAIELRWEGRPLVLSSPLTKPESITVSLEIPDPSSVGTWGATSEVSEDTEDIIVETTRGAHEVTCRLTAGPVEQDAATVRLYADGRSKSPIIRPRLACAHEEGFDVPPRLATVVAGAADAEFLRIEGLDKGNYRIGMGQGDEDRCTLWRAFDVDGHVELTLDPRPLSRFLGGRAAGSLPLTFLSAKSLERKDGRPHRFGPDPGSHGGPRELWLISEKGFQTHATLTTLTKSSLAGESATYTLERFPVDLPPFDQGPADEVDTLNVVVSVPGSLDEEGRRYKCTLYGDQVRDPQLPPAPEGWLEAELWLKDGTLFTLSGLLGRDGLVSPAGWSGGGRATRQQIRSLVLRRPDATPVEGARVNSLEGTPLGATDEEGRLAIPIYGDIREPQLVHVYPPEPGFDYHVVLSGEETVFELNRRGGESWDWARFNQFLGVDLQSLGCTALKVRKLPLGESVTLYPRLKTAIELGDRGVIDCWADREEDIKVWGWMQASRASELGESEGRAQLVLSSGAGGRTVYVLLPNAAIQLTLRAEEVQTLQVMAPVVVEIVDYPAREFVYVTTLPRASTFELELLPGDIAAVDYE